MKKEKLRHYATVIAGHADSAWVTPVFFLMFFIDSLVLVLPVDSLMATTMTLRPQHVKKWLVASISGFALGLGILAAIANSKLQPLLFELMERWGYLNHAMDAVKHAQNYGYWELVFGVFTFVPSLFGVLAGVLVGLNPWAVWAISLGGKVVKILLTVKVIFSTSDLAKKILRFYLKTSV
jgi:membrane protein YqaA with SNARE-associated domain